MPLRKTRSLVSLLLFTVALIIAAPALMAATLVRGPYLQQPAPDQIVIRWRTKETTDAVVTFGRAPGALNREVRSRVRGADHEAKLDGLEPATRYYYAIGDADGVIASGSDFHFTTAPLPGRDTPTRIWVLGDPGSQSGAGSRAVRDAYAAWSGSRRADMILMLGDNAYTAGLDHQYQVSVFDRFKTFLRNTPLWSVIGNHEGNKGGKREDSSDSVEQSGPYYDIFSFPKKAESGGVASNTEAYYSFDHGNIHFVMLDSYFSTDNRENFRARMVAWLKSDLSNQNAKWIIAAWHHSPYSKGSHDSDEGSRETYLRKTILPILESHGVDLVLTGHSHAYERSYFLHGLYADSGELKRNPALVLDRGTGHPAGVLLSDGIPATGAYRKSRGGKGTVYVVTGNASSVSKRGRLDHPAMVVAYRELGSVVIDIQGDTLTSIFLNDKGLVRDSFAIEKDAAAAVSRPDMPPATNSAAVAASPPRTETVISGKNLIVEKRISGSLNDVEERDSGSMYLDSSDLEMTQDKQRQQTIGLRFDRLKLPAGAKITTAWIQFEVDEVGVRETALRIQGELTAYSKKFTSRRFDLTSRASTKRRVIWNPAPWRKKSAHGVEQRTPDLAAVVQEIIDQTHWQSENAMTFIISGTGKRVAESFDGEPGAAPLLHLEYQVKP
jgi:hypothetical protein